jgi:hypothetical protein
MNWATTASDKAPARHQLRLNQMSAAAVPMRELSELDNLKMELGKLDRTQLDVFASMRCVAAGRARGARSRQRASSEPEFRRGSCRLIGNLIAVGELL